MTNWLKKSFEDYSSKASSKRLTAFWLVALTTLLLLAGIRNIYLARDISVNYLYFIMIMLGALMLLLMVITVENIIQLIKAIRGNG